MRSSLFYESIFVTRDTAGRYAAAMTAFCKEMGWAALETLIARYSSRLEKGIAVLLAWGAYRCLYHAVGVRQELVALVGIPMVGRTRARQLFAAGTVGAVLLVVMFVFVLWPTIHVMGKQATKRCKTLPRRDRMS